jgi:aspartyl-tRNA(Asn)/glutamyl-tRNA(Gln) amidotransferase subunit B
LAIHGRIAQRSIFARKNYFYPDLPKGYQISQYEDPVVANGWLEIELPVSGTKGRSESEGKVERKRIGITRAHLEEDAGKSIHDAAIAGADDTHIDLNRAGVPLLEIVSEPDMRSAAEAGAYLRKLRQILRYTGVSEADMEKGQFRCDANVSLRPRGETEFGTRTELKNINSFRFVERAIEAEIERQADILESGGQVQQATMAYDTGAHRTKVLRLKENADDYRYFPDPDLVALVISDEQIEAARQRMPELPDAKRERFQSEYGLSPYDAGLLIASRAVSDFFEAAVTAHGTAKTVANWLLRDMLQALNERDCEIDDPAVKLEPEGFAALLKLVDEKRVTARSARELVPDLIDEGGDPEALIRERGLEAVSDVALIAAMVDEVIAANRDAAQQVREGSDKPLNFLMGQVMQRSQGKANPGQVRDLLAQKLKG